MQELTEIIRLGKIDLASQFINKDNVNHTLTLKKETALHFAVLYGKKDILDFLLSLKANPNLKMLDGYTPLHTAAEKGYHEIVLALLKHGANPNETTFENLAFGDGNKTPLHLATMHNHISIIQRLLEHGADVNAKTTSGFSKTQGNTTALHYAALGGFDGATKLLIEHGAKTDTRDNKGRTPLHYAVMVKSKPSYFSPETHKDQYLKRKAIIDYLLEKNPILVFSKDNNNETPTELATRHISQSTLTRKFFSENNLSLVQYLISKTPQQFSEEQKDILLKAGLALEKQNKNLADKLYALAQFPAYPVNPSILSEPT